jgi:hypothetical protein
MMAYYLDGKRLQVDGKSAQHEDCCCGGAPCDCPTGLADSYRITGYVDFYAGSRTCAGTPCTLALDITVSRDPESEACYWEGDWDEACDLCGDSGYGVWGMGANISFSSGGTPCVGTWEVQFGVWINGSWLSLVSKVIGQSPIGTYGDGPCEDAGELSVQDDPCGVYDPNTGECPYSFQFRDIEVVADV